VQIRFASFAGNPEFCLKQPLSMAIAVNLDFENPYEIHPLTEDLRINAFETELQDGSTFYFQQERLVALWWPEKANG
jgi:hypothetical protein